MQRRTGNRNRGDHAPTFHLKTAEIPKYKGSQDKITPYDFLIALEKYKAVCNATNEFLVHDIIPLALHQQAYEWYRFEIRLNPFVSYTDFKQRFRREFQPVGYASELHKELVHRTQVPLNP